MDLIIRDFVGQDGAEVLAMIQALSVYHDSTAKMTGQQLVQAVLHDRLTHCIVAERLGAVVGCLLYHIRFHCEHGTRTCCVQSLYTQESFRGHGIGGALMRRAAVEALRLGCFQFEVGAHNKNTVSNSFYAGLGMSLRPSASNMYALQAEALKAFAGLTPLS